MTSRGERQMRQSESLREIDIAFETWRWGGQTDEQFDRLAAAIRQGSAYSSILRKPSILSRRIVLQHAYRMGEFPARKDWWFLFTGRWKKDS